MKYFALFMIFFLSFPAQAQDETKDPIVIGDMHSYTLSPNQIRDIWNGMDLAVKEINEVGGVLVEFLGLLGDVVGQRVDLCVQPREVLQANGFLPDCSPFSDVWMSELDNTRSKQELDMRYTPVPVYLERIVAHHQQNPPRPPVSYRRRAAEKQLCEDD